MQVLNHHFECCAAPERAHCLFPSLLFPAWMKRATTGTWTDDNNLYLFKLLLHFPFTFENRVVSFATLLLGSFQRGGGGDWGYSKETFKCSSLALLSVSHSFTQFNQTSPFCSSGQNVAPERVILSHTRGAIFTELTTHSHSPHNSCLLHFSWLRLQAHRLPFSRAPRLNSRGHLYVCFCSPGAGNQQWRSRAKSKHLFRRIDCVGTAREESPPPPLVQRLNFLMSIGHLIHMLAFISETEQGVSAQRWGC